VSPLILVIGANGRVGRTVVDVLLSHGVRPRLMVRDSDAAQQRFGSQVDITSGDICDLAALQTAVDGASAVFLCTPVDPDQVAMQANVITAVKDVGAHLVKVSGLATFPGSFVDSGRWHAETETAAAAVGLSYTFLHPYFFTQNLLFQLATVREKGVLSAAVDDAKIAMVDTRDIAAVSARILIEPELARNKTLVLTQNVSLDYEEIAAAFASVLGRPVTYRRQTIGEVEQNLRRAGQPDWHIELILQFNRAFTQGLGSQTSSAINEILGRDPIDLLTSLKDAGSLASDANPFPN